MAVRQRELQDVVLQLPASLRDRAEEMALRESVSLNLFVLTALAEKLQRMQLDACFGGSDEPRPETDVTSDPWLRVH
jgi:hypothetical protein